MVPNLGFDISIQSLTNCRLNLDFLDQGILKKPNHFQRCSRMVFQFWNTFLQTQKIVQLHSLSFLRWKATLADSWKLPMWSFPSPVYWSSIPKTWLFSLRRKLYYPSTLGDNDKQWNKDPYLMECQLMFWFNYILKQGSGRHFIPPVDIKSQYMLTWDPYPVLVPSRGLVFLPTGMAIFCFGIN